MNRTRTLITVAAFSASSLWLLAPNIKAGPAVL